MEQSYVVHKRIEFLREYKINKTSQYSLKPVVLDETWIFSKGAFRKSWQYESLKTVRKKSGEGARYIILQAWSEDGLINNASLVFKSGSKSGDYHDSMNGANFEHCCENQLLPNLEEPSRIILDNASYHSQAEKNPTKRWSKKALVEWLNQKSVQFPAVAMKDQIWNIVKSHIPAKRYNDKQGVEVVIRFTTDLEYDDKIFTDANGRETIERTRNFRPTWNATISEPESGNYYPIVSGISLKSSTAEISFLNDRAQGGGSMNYQHAEFMIHRNTIKTGGGVGEALNEQAFETGVVSRGSHYIVFTDSEFSQASEPTPKEISQQISLDSWIFFSSPNGLSFKDYQKSHVMEYSGLANTSLPRNIHILTLEPWGDSTVLLRLENFVGKEDTWHSGTSIVDVQEIFSAFNVVSLRETTLAGNQWLEENSRIRFNWASDKGRNEVRDEKDFKITLEPMQIRTFIVTISY